MAYSIKGYEVESFAELPDEVRREAARDILTELYKIWCEENGQELKSLEIIPRGKKDAG